MPNTHGLLDVNQRFKLIFVDKTAVKHLPPSFDKENVLDQKNLGWTFFTSQICKAGDLYYRPSNLLGEYDFQIQYLVTPNRKIQFSA
jgi:hypothetical protein